MNSLTISILFCISMLLISNGLFAVTFTLPACASVLFEKHLSDWTP